MKRKHGEDQTSGSVRSNDHEDKPESPSHGKVCDNTAECSDDDLVSFPSVSPHYSDVEYQNQLACPWLQAAQDEWLEKVERAKKPKQ